MMCKPILIVEDDPDISLSLQEFFEGEGYTIFLANHGRAALDFIKKNPAIELGMILLDLMMPEMDGATFLLELKRNYPGIFSNTPTFIITAGGDAHQFQIETTGFLKKPFDLDELSKLATLHCTQL